MSGKGWVVNAKKTHAVVIAGDFVYAGQEIPEDTPNDQIEYMKKEELIVRVGKEDPVKPSAPTKPAV